MHGALPRLRLSHKKKRPMLASKTHIGLRGSAMSFVMGDGGLTREVGDCG